MSEDCYTLEEANVILRQRACVTWGHDWTIVSLGNGEPFELVCDNCSETRNVVKP